MSPAVRINRTTVPRIARWLLICAGFVTVVGSAAHAQFENSGSRDSEAARLHAAHALFNRKTRASDDRLTELAHLLSRGETTGLRVAELYIQAGLPERALAALQSATGTRAALSTRLTIAGEFHRSGNSQRAQEILAGLPATLPVALQQQQASLAGRILLEQGQFDEAALPLAAALRRDQLSPIDRYNLGIAWLGAGATDRGAGELNSLGRYQEQETARRALADQANLTLAFWLLERGQAEPARRLLWRIPLASPLARKGMLALGWTEFTASRGELTLTEVEVRTCKNDSPALWEDADPLHQVGRNRCRVRSLERSHDSLAATPGYREAASKHERAALAWSAAIDGGDARDPVVAEALAALPYALVRTGDMARAQQAWETAITHLESALQSLTDTVVSTKAYADPAQPLTHTRQSLLQSRERLFNQVASGLAAARTENARDVGEIINALRIESRRRDLGDGLGDNNAGNGRRLATPNAVQRGRLLLALSGSRPPRNTASTQQGYRSYAGKQQIERLEQRTAALHQSINQALGAVERATRQDQHRQVQARRAKLRRYLTRSRLGLSRVPEK